jgi:CubicO group peptidase (beta-lactamase class C family)
MVSSTVAHNAPIVDFMSEIDALVADSMSEWKIPGLALAVVQNGTIALLKAYGCRDIEAGLPTTTDTHFMICSITKSFTSTGLAMLVDERRLDWKKPVRDYIPEFRLHDPVATDRITVSDLLCHHSGLPRHDWIHLPGDLSPTQMLAAMRYLEPSEDIRSTFQYQNLCYLVAGMVAERVSGQTWTEFTRARLTDKLRMTVTFTAEELAASADAAAPYSMDGDTRLRANLYPIRTIPAGGINTSVASLANWLRFHLDKGTFEGQRLLSPTLIQELQTPRVYVAAAEFAEFGAVHYGLGFGSQSYRGERVVSHGGGWIGWSTLLTLLPDRGLGVAVFTNRGDNPVPGILANYVFDRACGKEVVPWLDRYRERRHKALAQRDMDRQAHKAVQRPDTRPSHPLADYVGDYDHPGYGRMSITSTGHELQWTYRGMSAPLAHRHYDTFELPEAPERLLPDRLAISFFTDREGNITSLSAPFEPLVKDIVFARIPAGECMDVAFRKQCIGNFSRPQMTVVVAQDNDGQLMLTVGSQPTYKLIPYQARTFVIAELEGFRVEFRRDADGRVSEAIFHQPNGTFVAPRVEP